MKPYYYSDDSVTIYNGDALELLPTLTEYSVQLVVLDPPYAMVPNSFAGKDDGAAGTSGAPIRLLTETLRESHRVLRPGGVVAILCDWRRVPDVSYLTTLVGLRLSGCVAWTRNRVGIGGLFRSAWDPVLIASVGTPDQRDGSAVRNVVSADLPGISREHPYEKPHQLWQHVTERVPVGTVLDPFAGSGASGVAARLSGHKWIGIEVNERYCEIAARRLGQEVFDFGEAS